MGLFDVFQKGGKYFGKDIEPHCEYCEFGKRAKDGNKVLCDKRGLVDADFHCGKFSYSPLKRIPVKQMNRVGFTDDDDEFNDIEEEAPAPASVKQEVPPLDLPEEKPVAAEKPAEEPAPVTAEASAPAEIGSAEADALQAPVNTAESTAPAAETVQETPSEEDAAADLAAEEALRALEQMNR